MLDILKELCVLPGAPGGEDMVREYVIKRIESKVDEVIVDAMGNVIAHKKGAAKPKNKIMFCAHMDEVGLIVTYIDDKGHLRFHPAGEVDKRVVVGKAVTIGKNNVYGVISCKPVHLLSSDERTKAIKFEDMHIDIGANSREEAEKLVSLGDVIVYDDDMREFGDGFIKTKAIDDRLGCAVMIKLIESDLPYDCSFAFTVQEEVGMRGSHTAANRVAPDIAVVVEGTTVADLPSVPDVKKVCKPRGGVVIPFMDGATIYNRELYGIFTKLAEKNNIPWQTKTVVAGWTDASSIQRSRAGVKTLGIAAPVRNLHSQSCVVKISDMDYVFELAKLAIPELAVC